MASVEQFEDHCWQDVVPAADMKLYSCYARATRVGPRPALPWEVELFTPEQRRRHASLPGLTGLWQVSGRNRLSMQQMLALDLAYVDRCTLLQDLEILLRTPAAVLLDRATR